MKPTIGLRLTNRIRFTSDRATEYCSLPRREADEPVPQEARTNRLSKGSVVRLD
jgi:hypothetical protein